MSRPISPDRRRRLKQHHVEILRRPTQHAYPNLNLANYIERGSVGWATWRRFNRQVPLWRAVWPFLLQLVGGYGLRNEQQIVLDHERMLDERRCHSWNGMGWCFCDERPPPPPDWMDINVELGPRYPWWVAVVVVLIVTAPVAYLIWLLETGRIA